MIYEYIWIGGNLEIRSKTRIYEDVERVEDLPDWNFDGSSTGQAEGHYSEIIIKPKVLFPCPFRKELGKLVLCDTYYPNGEPHETNKRYEAEKIFQKKKDSLPWYGLEQEYFIIDNNTGFPFGVNPNEKIVQGQYYCSVGGENAFGRVIVEQHLQCCLYSGLKISGSNAEVAPAQWEFQIGPALGIEAGDHLWIARYLLERISEFHNVRINWDPKPFKTINGSGCHCNYSTKEMREEGGIDYIYKAIQNLEKYHMEHMEVYGEHNNERMTGKHETASYHHFSSGEGDRGASIRIGNDVIKYKKGYFEDRRPASNCDPYLVTSKIFETTVLR